jgi:shikimate dehydrogenase
VLHRAAYAALGLTGWTYDKAEVRAGELAAYVDSRPPEWVGLSVTRPGKEEALALAGDAGPDARLTGGANTLVRTTQGWHADNTDVTGLVTALTEAAGPGADPLGGRPPAALVVGSGATARSTLVAVHRLGVVEVWLQVRREVRAAARTLADALGLRVHPLGPDDPAPAADRLALVVSTVPAGGAPPPTPSGSLEGLVALDVVYDPWPTPWATALARRGATVLDGRGMLLHQAARQVELMTGAAAPVEAMRAALEATTAAGTVADR